MSNALEQAKLAQQEVARKEETRKLIKDIRDADDITQKNITILLKQDVFGTGPRNAEELYKALEVLYGLKIGYTATGDEWTPPFEWVYANYFDKYEQILGVAGRGTGKALCLKTPIPTPTGWKTMGDLQVGDYVFDEEGCPTRVTFVTEVMYDHPCYEVEFTDGTKIVADAEHLWEVESRNWVKSITTYKTNKPRPILTTEEIATKVSVNAGKTRRDLNYNVRLAKPVQYSEKEQPIDPYIFGIWLGDGSKRFGAISTADQEILDAIQQHYEIRHKGQYDYTVYGLQAGLSKLGVLLNKHIPDCYLYGSVEQRIALLQGLMDSDGTASTTGQLTIGFSNNKRLIEQTQELILSLGIKAKVTQKRAKLYNKDCGIYYRINFAAQFPVFRLSRKLARQCIALDKKCKYGKNGRFIKAVTPVESVPVKCITVDSPNHLYLCSRSFIPTHNTVVASAFTHLKCAHRPSYEAVHFGARKVQAKVARQYLHNYGNDEVLKLGMDQKGVLQEKAQWVSNGSRWHIVAGTMAGVSGQHPNMLSIDEIEFLDELTLEQAWAVPMERNGYRRLWTGFSTRQRPSSVMTKLVNDAETGKRNIKLFQWSVFETMQPCQTCLCIKGDRVVSEPEKACPLWRYCSGTRAKKSTGWMKREAVVNLMETMTKEAFETQMLCLRPTSHGLVLHNFVQDYATSLDLNKGNFMLWAYQPDLPVYAFHDPAENHKSAILLVQVFNGRVFGFDELVHEDGPTLSTIKIDLDNLCRTKGYATPKAVIVDPRRTDIVKQWREGSLSADGAHKSFNAVVPTMRNGMDEIEAGLELLRSYVRNGLGEVKFYLNPRTCPKHVTALTQNSYKLNKSNELIEGAKQEAKYKDEVDEVRYGIIYLHQQVIRSDASGFSF